ncbi:hypothetical protein A2W54_03435 [Candidatus Giovannonibacteria bacterium RIFCSPHIGHO2_02_43_13]|uniref:Uncharacterized protein n=1 Tax=Candidatus Giovannonibacteria bacterium RIFCSPHIGHO2_02_43_13 TaxID=1798330 RepID=A0A1F5WQ99_9BACT|nr:MAG: hypothetical protein UW28_C0004G0031 [Parcubacteria group bacterium GW2011_GWA2_44_13]OGF73938.1 MAG: hypothetical protein A3E06_00645 [Candidatus Giovannonibacteria bacterium RIFCSPHIGHO2_12_FULL_44_42]OGF77829.1 MAG: hypothetical protein A2W54_03435 [Candidatus Giovannonibacteria bacterium RIFCSPHIGHO2_02_43_13]OGF88836.1 MAG: hypothetical protein A3I94_02420 [Candidatus Giovannonibacteria bacterium RIFCSPLOWO2_02_FULL_43_54]OGF96800.1 MAG: hypothetical protein A3H08_01310 [Candidatus
MIFFNWRKWFEPENMEKETVPQEIPIDCKALARQNLKIALDQMCEHATSAEMLRDGIKNIAFTEPFVMWNPKSTFVMLRVPGMEMIYAGCRRDSQCTPPATFTVYGYDRVPVKYFGWFIPFR